MKKTILTLCATALVCGCANNEAVENPLLAEFNTPFGVPPFDEIKPEHYMPAFELGMITPASTIKDMPLQFMGDRPFPYNDNRDRAETLPLHPTFSAFEPKSPLSLQGEGYQSETKVKLWQKQRKNLSTATTISRS